MFGNPFFNPTNKTISLSGILSKTGKALNIANKAIPVYYQVKPVIKNTKSFFNMFKSITNETNKIKPINNIKKESVKNIKKL